MWLQLPFGAARRGVSCFRLPACSSVVGRTAAAGSYVHTISYRCGSSVATSNGVPSSQRTSKQIRGLALEQSVASHIPMRFMKVSQIARSLPDDVMELLQNNDCSLLSYLESHSSRFVVSRAGGIPRARLRYPLKGSPQEVPATPSPFPPLNSAARSRNEGSQPHLSSRYPSFCIPLTALLETCPGMSLAEVWQKVQEEKSYLTVLQLSGKDAAEEERYSRTYVTLNQMYCPSSRSEADKVLDTYQVEPYEWFRLARLFPYVRYPVAVNPTLLSEAANLLPEGRDPLHVLASAPELFHCAVGDGDDGELGEVSVRFLLHPSYSMQPESLSAEEVRRQLGEMVGFIPQRLKRKRRRLRRALQFLEEPVSFLDERVWAYFMFDLLPVTGSVSADRVISMIPDNYKQCTPVQWRSTLQKFPSLFKVFNGPNELLLQRADLPSVEVRPFIDITAEEVLQEVFKAYPLRFHPELGVTVCQMLTKLPRNVCQRLYSMKNVEVEVMKKFPDKVEILRRNTFFVEEEGGPPTLSTSGRFRVPYKNRADMLQQVRGREDFLVAFRFIGEWQDRLEEKFVKRCQKYECDPNSTGMLPIPV